MVAQWPPWRATIADDNGRPDGWSLYDAAGKVFDRMGPVSDL